MENDKEFTQKDLMQHLLQAAQHSATREELNQVKTELKGDINALRKDIEPFKTLEYRLTIKLGAIMIAGISALAVLMKIL